jgi:DNA-binding XRE family transcriptional regulator
MNWQNLFKGVRNKLDLSQSELSGEIDISRRQISRYETEYRTPNEEAQEEILRFIEDREIIAGEKFRNKNKVADVVEEIFDRDGYSTMKETLEVNKRTIRKWRNGKRTPSPQKSFKLKQILEV